MKDNKNKDFEEIYEDVVIDTYGIPVVITDVLVLKHKNTGRNIYINHPDSIPKVERALKAVFGDAPKKFINYRKKLNISGSTLFIQLPDEIKDSYHLESNSHAVITPIGQKKALVEFEVS